MLRSDQEEATCNLQGNRLQPPQSGKSTDARQSEKIEKSTCSGYVTGDYQTAVAKRIGDVLCAPHGRSDDLQVSEITRI